MGSFEIANIYHPGHSPRHCPIRVTPGKIHLWDGRKRRSHFELERVSEAAHVEGLLLRWSLVSLAPILSLRQANLLLQPMLNASCGMRGRLPLWEWTPLLCFFLFYLLFLSNKDEPRKILPEGKIEVVLRNT